jgi:ankyrin repeat protein
MLTNVSQKHGVTALLAAAANGHPKTCQLLLDHGANITALDKRNRSCFFLACGSGNPETALFIASKLEGENEKLLFLKSDAGKTPLTKAAAKGHTEVVKLLLSKIDPAAVNEKDNKLGHTPLHVAAMNGSKDIVELLIENGASTTVTDTKGHTPFKHCCQTWAQSHSRDAGALLLLMDKEPIESLQDYELLNTAAVKGNVPVLERLVQNGVSVHQMDKHGWTPLQIVSQYGHTEAISFLTEKGAIIGRKPTAWSCDIKWVKISEDGKDVEWLSEGIFRCTLPLQYTS